MLAINCLATGIFDIFANISAIGDKWGEPWGTILPVFVALVAVFSAAAGTRYVFTIVQDQIEPIFIFTLLVIGVLTFMAIRETDQSQVPALYHPESPNRSIGPAVSATTPPDQFGN